MLLATMLKGMIGGDQNATLDRLLDECDARTQGLEGLLQAPEGAAPRHTFTSTAPPELLSMATVSAARRLRVAPTMIRMMGALQKSTRYYDARFKPDGREARPELFVELEEAARRGGAAAVRYVSLPDDSIFRGKGVPHRNVIVYAVAMRKEALDTAPSFEAFQEVARAYLRLLLLGNRLTELLRARGHAAYPGTALGGLTDYTRLAELAGLGAIGYHGLLITPEDGVMLRLNTIYTSIENLPTVEAEEVGWIRDFCAMCGKCVRSCPVDAIHPRPVAQDSGRVQCIDAGVCLDYFAQNFGCAVCADVCPFTQVGYDRIRRRFKGNPTAPRYTLTTEPS
ncbi:MAG: 4Fe-4S binding protein [Alphaproteobacteria bacterium]|nr:4Fe-4S binding protein [Alphaproteobacteria bacterium]